MVHANKITVCSSLERDGKSSYRATHSLTKGNVNKFRAQILSFFHREIVKITKALFVVRELLVFQVFKVGLKVWRLFGKHLQYWDNPINII